MNDSKPVFVDTNVLVYAFDATEPSRQTVAERVLSDLLQDDRIRLSTQILQEFYVTVTRKVKSPLDSGDALAIMDDLALWPVIAVDYSLIREAASLSEEASLSFWDSLVLTAAARSGAKILLTEDLNHGQTLRDVQIVNPFLPPLVG